MFAQLSIRRFMYYFIFSALFFIVPLLIFAADPIVPCDGVNVPCDACQLVALGQNILNFFILITISIVTVVFAWAGLTMVMSAGDTGKVSRAKEMFTNALIGLILVLAAWLIVDTLMKVFLGGSIGPWNELLCAAGGAATTVTPSSTKSPGTVIPGQQPSGVGALSDSAARQVLSDAQISVISSGNCTDRNNKTCTSLDGIQSGTLDVVREINQLCIDCNLRVTAGTEVGHTNPCHRAGTCVDVNCAGGCNIKQINTLQAASSGNTKVVYEVKTQADKDALVQQGALPGNIEVVSWISAPHASVYTQ